MNSPRAPRKPKRCPKCGGPKARRRDVCETCAIADGAPLSSSGRPLTIGEQIRQEAYRRCLALMKARQLVPMPDCAFSEAARKPHKPLRAEFDGQGNATAEGCAFGEVRIRVRRAVVGITNAELMSLARADGILARVTAEVAREMAVVAVTPRES